MRSNQCPASPSHTVELRMMLGPAPCSAPRASPLPRADRSANVGPLRVSAGLSPGMSPRAQRVAARAPALLDTSVALLSAPRQ
eukprot:7211047-Pyramimonas_sp.AAC.1